MTAAEIAREARKLYAKRDELESRMRDINARLRQLRSEYMIAERTCGLREERFRIAVKA